MERAGAPSDSHSLADHSLHSPLSPTHQNTTSRRRALDVGHEQESHVRHIQTALAAFTRLENKHERAYRRLVCARKPLAKVGRHLVDACVIESIVDERNGRWRAELARGTDPYEISAPIDIRRPLPAEKERMQRKCPRVFYWG
jgi:hypothetical protein